MKNRKRGKQWEEALSRLGAKVAEATAIAQRTSADAQKAQYLLISAQQEIEALYLQAGEDVSGE